ncbi:hypothetical protein D3C80_2101740 [compost metagenome]
MYFHANTSEMDGVTYERITSERAVLRRRNSRLKKIATARPRPVLPSTTSAVYQKVIHNECQNAESPRIRI